MRSAPVSTSLFLLAVTTGVPPLPAAPSPPPAVLVSGELVRLDLGRGTVTVKTEGRDGRDLEAGLTDATQLLARGRALRPEDLRPGDRVVLGYSEEGGRRIARVIKVAARAALPVPSPPPH